MCLQVEWFVSPAQGTAASDEEPRGGAAALRARVRLFVCEVSKGREEYSAEGRGKALLRVIRSQEGALLRRVQGEDSFLVGEGWRRRAQC